MLAGIDGSRRLYLLAASNTAANRELGLSSETQADGKKVLKGSLAGHPGLLF
jgi:hypothetical protein